MSLRVKSGTWGTRQNSYLVKRERECVCVCERERKRVKLGTYLPWEVRAHYLSPLHIFPSLTPLFRAYFSLHRAARFLARQREQAKASTHPPGTRYVSRYIGRYNLRVDTYRDGIGRM